MKLKNSQKLDHSIEVMTDAKHVATMTRDMADLIDTRGQGVISLFNEYSSSGNK